jgi:hypothetical protein
MKPITMPPANRVKHMREPDTAASMRDPRPAGSTSPHEQVRCFRYAHRE